MDVAGALTNCGLGTILALGVILLGLAAAVQIILEGYKYLSRSEARTYRKVLVDFTDPSIEQLYEPGFVNDLQIRTPWQIRKVRPRGILLPMSKDQLVHAVERLAPVWTRRTLEQLRLERELQTTGMEPEMQPMWSPDWYKLLHDMRTLDRDDATHWDALRVLAFVDKWQEGKELQGPTRPRKRSYDAQALLVAFRQQFFPEAARIEQYFPQLERNIEYSYHRRNLRQVFVVALLLSLLFHLPFVELLAQGPQPSFWGSIVSASAGVETGESGLQIIFDNLLTMLDYALDTFITALLVSFGALFWQNLMNALGRGGRVSPGRSVTEEK